MTIAAVAQALPATPDWNQIDACEVLSPPSLIGGTTLRLELCAHSCFLQVFEHGIRFFSEQQREYDYGLLLKEVAVEKLTLSLYEDKCLVQSLRYAIQIQYSPFALEIRDVTTKALISASADDGHFVRQHRVPPLAKTEQGWYFSHRLRSNEAIYGLGEKWGALNKRGQLLRSYNCDALGVNAEVSYKNTPFCWSPEGWGIFIHTPASVTHAIGHPSWSQRSYCCLIEDDVLDIFLLLTPDSESDDVNMPMNMISAYTDLTGRAPKPPNWSGGVILSKAYYQDPQELLAVAHEVRKRKMPCDTITIDGRAWQDTKTRFAFEWDQSRWPQPKAVLDELKALGFKVCVWEYPLISVQHEWFNMFAEKGWLLKDKRTSKTYIYQWDEQAFGRILTELPESGIVDFTHPEAYSFWRDAHRELYAIGVDMIKADFGEQLEDDNMIAANGESGLALHNVYAHLYNRCVYEAAEKYSSNGAFLFSRSSWIGCQRFNSQWGGDPQADWEGMMGNIRGGLSWGLSGAPFYATDIGGFYKDTRDDALYVRWAQAAVFSAHFRLHGIGDREPWSYSSEACKAAMKALELRYRLQTYLQQLMVESSHTGIPVQRPMVLALPKEKQAWAFENQFMFGDSILVAPCFDPDGYVEYYLPAGKWVRFQLDAHEHEIMDGGQVIKEKLTLEQTAVFVRAGTEIPLNDPVETTEQIPLDSQGRFLATSAFLPT